MMPLHGWCQPPSGTRKEKCGEQAANELRKCLRAEDGRLMVGTSSEDSRLMVGTSSPGYGSDLGHATHRLRPPAFSQKEELILALLGRTYFAGIRAG